MSDSDIQIDHAVLADLPDETAQSIVRSIAYVATTGARSGADFYETVVQFLAIPGIIVSIYESPVTPQEEYVHND